MHNLVGDPRKYPLLYKQKVIDVHPAEEFRLGGLGLELYLGQCRSPVPFASYHARLRSLPEIREFLGVVSP